MLGSHPSFAPIIIMRGPRFAAAPFTATSFRASSWPEVHGLIRCVRCFGRHRAGAERALTTGRAAPGALPPGQLGPGFLISRARHAGSRIASPSEAAAIGVAARSSLRGTCTLDGGLCSSPAVGTVHTTALSPYVLGSSSSARAPPCACAIISQESPRAAPPVPADDDLMMFYIRAARCWKAFMIVLTLRSCCAVAGSGTTSVVGVFLILRSHVEGEPSGRVQSVRHPELTGLADYVA